MADKLGLGHEVRELKIGQSFTNPKSTAFHSVRYDFKPASVGSTNKKATLDVGSNHQVTVTLPHADGAGAPTVYKGSQRPYQKECVLIFDRATGEITLEKLACNIQVKKTRSEYNKPLASQEPIGGPGKSGQSSSTSSNLSRSQTPPIGQRISHKTKVTSGSRRPDRPITHLVPKHSPLHASPSYPSPGHHPHKSPKPHAASEASHNPSTLASLPMIGIDDFSEAAEPPPPQPPAIDKSPKFHPQPPPPHEINGVGEITDSSSSSSDSDSDSELERAADGINRTVVGAAKTNGHTNGAAGPAKINTHLLNEDLCLSETGSESDWLV